MSDKDEPLSGRGPPSARSAMEESAKLLLRAERDLNDLKARYRREAKKLETVLTAAWRLRDMEGDRLFDEVLRLFVEELDHDRGVVLAPADPREHIVATSIGFEAQDGLLASCFAWPDLAAAEREGRLAALLSERLELDHCMAGLIPFEGGPLVLAVGRSPRLAQFLDPLDESDRRVFGLLCSHVAGQLDNQRFVGRLRAEHDRLRLAHRELRGKSAELGEARRQLERADRMAVLGEFLSSAIGDIRDPLGAVSDGVEQIEAGARALGGAYESLAALYARRIPTATAEILALEARHGSGAWKDGLPAHAQRAREAVASLEVAVSLLTRFSEDEPNLAAMIDLGEVARGAMHLGSSVVRGRATVELRADATPAVRGDMPRLMQVVLNLLMNAIQAMPPHRPPARNRISVRVQTAAEGADGPKSVPRVVLSVEDNGPGIDPAIAPRIFEPFFTTKPAGAGTGLGLAVSRRIVEEHGGTLTFTSKEGATRFEVSLPAARAPR